MVKSWRKNYRCGINRSRQASPAGLIAAGLLSVRLKMGKQRKIHIYKGKGKIITFVALYYPVKQQINILT